METARPQDHDVGGDAEARRLRKRRIEYRRGRLLHDAREVSELFAPHLAVLAFPAAGKPTLFGNPTVESVLRRFLPDADDGVEAWTGMRREAGPIEAQEQARLRAVAEKVKAAQEKQGREHWWEVDPAAIGEEELPDFATALDVVRADVRRRLDKLAKAPKPPQRH